VEQFAAAHAAMGAADRQGFEAFRAAGFEAAAGDAAVRGKDREPARLLDESGDRIAAASAAVADQAAAAGHSRPRRRWSSWAPPCGTTPTAPARPTNQATQQNAALVEESAAAAERLKNQARQPAQSVAVFRLA